METPSLRKVSAPGGWTLAAPLTKALKLIFILQHKEQPQWDHAVDTGLGIHDTLHPLQPPPAVLHLSPSIPPSQAKETLSSKLGTPDCLLLEATAGPPLLPIILCNPRFLAGCTCESQVAL